MTYAPISKVEPGTVIVCICEDDGITDIVLDPDCPLYDSHLRLRDRQPLP